MFRKFFVRDEDGEEFDVREVTEKETEEIKEYPEALTGDEIKAIKMIAGLADKLAELVKKSEAEKVEEKEEVEETEKEEIEDEEIEEKEEYEKAEEKEELVDTDRKACDSRRSFGAIEKKKTRTVDDSAYELDVCDAWNKRYGG